MLAHKPAIVFLRDVNVISLSRYRIGRLVSSLGHFSPLRATSLTCSPLATKSVPLGYFPPLERAVTLWRRRVGPREGTSLSYMAHSLMGIVRFRIKIVDKA